MPLLVFSLAFFLRLYKLGELPRGIFWDEVANGYDAYSLLKTGRDLNNAFLPLTLRHFGIPLESLHVYLTIPFIKIFGLSVFSTRLVEALAGGGSVIATYYFVKELWNKEVAWLAAFLLAVSPWHLTFSRISFRANFVTFLIPLGLYLLLKAIKGHPKNLLACGLIFGLALHTYTITKVYLPLVFLSVIFLAWITKVNFRNLLSSKSVFRYVILSGLIFLVLALPAYYEAFFRSANERFEAISIFTTPYPLKQFLVNYWQHLSPRFLFFVGDENLRHNPPFIGQVFVVLIPFILFAWYRFWQLKSKKGLWLTLLFFLGLVPASLTVGGIPHALRTISALPYLEIVAAFGLVEFFKATPNLPLLWQKIARALVVLLILGNTVYFLHLYFWRYPPYTEEVFQFGLGEAITYAQTQSDQYQRIVITRQPAYPYIYVPFFSKMNPNLYRQANSVETIGKYYICPDLLWTCYDRFKGKEHDLYIARPGELPSAEVVYQVLNPEGKEAFRLVR